MSWAVCRPILWSLLVILAGSSGLLADNKASAEGSVQLTVAGVDTEGDDVIGKYVELRQNGTFIASGFMPVTFVISNATEYQVGAADFKNFLFDHWQDTGSTDRWRTVVLAEDTKIVAVYRIVIEDTAPPNDTGGGSGGGSSSGGDDDAGSSSDGGGGDSEDGSSSGGGRGGSHSNKVIILVPENGEIVSPTGISLSGITVGDPTSVEVAATNPDTGVITPYRTVTPRSAGDFTWWSFSLEVNDLAMTQIQVRALFSDGSQAVDTVDVSYYTGPGTNKSVRIMDSIRLADSSADNAGHKIDTTVGTVAGTVDLDNGSVPDSIETVVDEHAQLSFDLRIFFLIGIAISAFVAWLAGWKRHLPAHQFVPGA